MFLLVSVIKIKKKSEIYKSCITLTDQQFCQYFFVCFTVRKTSGITYVKLTFPHIFDSVLCILNIFFIIFQKKKLIAKSDYHKLIERIQ